MILTAHNVLAWISLALAGLGVVATVVLDFSGPSEAYPLGLGAVVTAVIAVQFAIRGEDVEDLPEWVQHSLVHIWAGGWLALMALGILGFATNGNTGS